MTVSAEQLRSFVEKYPPEETEATKPLLGPDAGSYTTEKLAEWLEACQVPHEDGRVGPGENGRGFWIECPGNTERGWPDGERHQDTSHSLTSGTACWVTNGHPRFECRHAHCGMGARGGKKTWKNLQAFYDPTGATQRRVLTGNVTFGGATAPQNTPIQGVSLQDTEEVEETPTPRYPLEVWKGTDYAEFADICCAGNFIPREFLIEAIKTVTGAVAGATLEIDGIEGGIPRFYTVLMGSAGSGKGTSISWATSVFKDIGIGTDIYSLLWSPATKIEDVPWVHIGACEEGFNSAPGMQRSNEKGQTRWLQTFEELDHMIEGSGIDGSGKALMGVNRQLYDREEFTTTTTGKRDAIAGKAKNSLLTGTTAELWTDMFAGKQVRGSGLFQRFNLIVSEETRKKGTLRKPNLGVFKTRFAARLLDLEENPVRLTATDKAIAALDEWFEQDKFNEVDGEVRGRLNVLAWRNALHVTWQRKRAEVGLSEILDAIRLSEYQFEMRIRHTPAEGENQWALVENKILNFLRANGRATRRELVKRLNLNRYGSNMVEKALSALIQAGEVGASEDNDHPGRKTIIFTPLS